MKKKQKELSRKHSGGSTDRDQAAEQIKDETEEEEEEEDSDLASIGKIVCLKNIWLVQSEYCPNCAISRSLLLLK